LSNRAFQEIGGMQAQADEFARLLRRYMRLERGMALLTGRTRSRRFDTMDHLVDAVPRIESTFRTLAHEARLARVKFPPSPFGTTVTFHELRMTYIVDGADLLNEGRIQNNCVFDFCEEARHGDMLVYRIDAPGRATLVLATWIDVGYQVWWVDACEMAGNQPPTPEIRDAVASWTETEHILPSIIAAQAMLAGLADGGR
jgi:hypothetical protein